MIILLIDSCVPLSQINSFFKARALLRHGVRRKARTVSPSCAMRHFKHSLKLFKDIKPKKNTIQRYYRNFADILLVKICQVTQMIWGHLRGTRNHMDTKSYSKRVCLTFRDGSTEMGDGEYAPAFDLSKLWAARI